MNKVFRVLAIVLLTTCYAAAQDGKTKVSFASFDSNLLKSLVLKNLNYVRDTLRVGRQLEEDSVLALAAQNHVTYLVKTGKNTHKQDNKKTATVEDRVTYFNGNYSELGENNGSTFIGKSVLLKKENKKVVYETYGDASEGIVKDMLTSSSQAQNLGNENFSNIGIGIAVDEESKKIYLVAVLGNKPYYHPAGVLQPDDAYGLNLDGEGECIECKKLIKNFPLDLQYGVKVENNEVLLYFSDLAVFTQLTEKAIDAIAVDIIRRAQFPCDAPNILNASPINKGVLLKPVKKKNLLKTNRLAAENRLLTKIGDLPANMAKEELEFNILYIKGKAVCTYQVQANPQTDSLQLLPMGLYVDTLTPNAQLLMFAKKNQRVRIPLDYEHQQTSYNPEELKVMFDYLNLNQYDIQSLDVLVMTEVDSDTLADRKTADGLSKSILEAFQSQQKSVIPVSVEIRKNWTQLYADVRKSSFRKYADKQRNQLLSQLNSSAKFKDSLLVLGSNQRKVYVFARLELKQDKLESKGAAIAAQYKKAIESENEKELLIAQKELFNAVYYKEVNASLVDSLVIPNNAKFANALVNQSTFKFIIDSNRVQEVYDQLLSLNQLSKGNVKTLYNLAALHILLASKNEGIDPSELLNEVNSLLVYGADKKAVNRLNSNVYLLKAEKAKRLKQLKARKEALKVVVANHKGAEMSEEEVAAFGANFDRFNDADAMHELLTSYVTQDYARKDVLISYLKVGVADKDILGEADFPVILENAYTVAPKEICGFFTTGGISYQLLDKASLKKFYCKNCQ